MARYHIYLAIFLVSLSSLAFEVLLTRVFSISQWNHLSFMVISIALFGFGASGAFLSILDGKKKGWEKNFSRRMPMALALVLYSISALAAYLVLNSIPLDYFRLPVDPVQSLYLLCAYLALSLPFFLTGLVVSAGFAALPARSGVVYFSTMFGSALGAILPFPSLLILEEGRLAVLFAAIPLMFLLLPMEDGGGRSKKTEFLLRGTGLVTAALALFLSIAEKGSAVTVNPSPYKALSQIMKFPETEIAESFSGIRGKIDLVRSPYLRFAPGLSLQFTGRLPNQSALFRDADSPLTLYEISSEQDAEFARYTVPYSAYVATPKESGVLVIQDGGGSAVPCALASGAKDITIVEQNPAVARIVRQHYEVEVVDDNPRSFLARSRKPYSVIHIEDWGASVPGAAALEQDNLSTVDAFMAYLDNLAPRGAIAVSGRLLLPPANAPRLWAAAYEALKASGRKNPADHLAMIRNWDVFTMIVFHDPIENTRALEDFADRMNFDPIYFPRMNENLANQYNVFEFPYYYGEIRKLKAAYEGGDEKNYFESYILDVYPQTDDRPFPNRFLKWTRVGDLYKTAGSRPGVFLLSGEIVVAAVFVEALIVAVFLLASPVMIASGKAERPRFFDLVFFLGVGAGFMFAEMYFIKQYTLLFASPAIGFTVVLSGVLVFSGIGGILSQKWGARALKCSLPGLALLFVLFNIWFSPAMIETYGFSVPSRYVFAYSALLLAGLLMGIPFSLGMRMLLKTPRDRAYAWAANGCASVLASIAAAQAAIGFGISMLAILASIAYLLSFLSAVAPRGRG